MPRPKKSNRSDGRYEVKRTIGYTANGDPVRKSFYGASKLEAEEAYQEYLHDRERREEAKKRTDFASWVNEWLYTYKEPDMKASSFQSSCKRPCCNYIIPRFEGKTLQEITNADVKRFFNDIRHLSQSYIDKIKICMKGIFETAIDNDMIDKNPCRNVTCKSEQEEQKKRTYDKETVEVMCRSKHKYALYVHILLRMGLRCSELCGLRWEDIDTEKGVLMVKQALTAESGVIYIDDPKSYNSKRKLVMPPDLIERIVAERGDASEYVATLNGKHITPDHFSQRQLTVFYNALGVPTDKRLSAHELRHTCGTLLYEETKDIYHVSRFLGHSEIGITTKIYVHSEMQEEKIHVDFDT